jgi:hypothetical protein
VVVQSAQLPPRHGEGNVASYNWINQLRRLQAMILRCGGDSIGSQKDGHASLKGLKLI